MTDMIDITEAQARDRARILEALIDLHYREVNVDEDEDGSKLAAWEERFGALLDEHRALVLPSSALNHDIRVAARAGADMRRDDARQERAERSNAATYALNAAIRAQREAGDLD